MLATSIAGSMSREYIQLFCARDEYVRVIEVKKSGEFEGVMVRGKCETREGVARRMQRPIRLATSGKGSKSLQISAKGWSLGLVNFVIAVANYFCLFARSIHATFRPPFSRALYTRSTFVISLVHSAFDKPMMFVRKITCEGHCFNDSIALEDLMVKSVDESQFCV